MIKMESFPRKSGHCSVFDVSEYQYIKDLKNKHKHQVYTDPNFDYNDQNYTHDIFEVFADETVDYKNIFKETLILLADENLVKGDLILFCGRNAYRNDGIAIYDGANIINLDYEIDDYGSLPTCFNVITNDVPVDYWVDLTNKKGISHNSIVWLDHSTIKQQCIDGVKIVNGRVTVNFDYNDKSYTLYDLSDDQYYDMVADPKGDYVPFEEYNTKERLKIVLSKLENNDLLMLNSVLDDDGIKLFLGGPFEIEENDEEDEDEDED